MKWHYRKSLADCPMLQFVVSFYFGPVKHEKYCRGTPPDHKGTKPSTTYSGFTQGTPALPTYTSARRKYYPRTNCWKLINKYFATVISRKLVVGTYSTIRKGDEKT